MDKAFLRPRLCGGRFNDGGIPLEVLPDLQALQELVVDVARWEYLRANVDRRQVPTGFAENLKLRLTAIEPGSAVAAISFFKEAETILGGRLDSSLTPDGPQIRYTMSSMLGVAADRSLVICLRDSAIISDASARACVATRELSSSRLAELR